MKQALTGNFKPANSTVSVTLYKSPFLPKDEYYAKVTRNVVTIENVIAEIIDENPGISPYMILHTANLLKKQILKQLSLGKAVNVLDLGVLYFGCKCMEVSPDGIITKKPKFDLRFRTSNLANSAIKNLKADVVVFPDTAPKIKDVIDTWTGTQNEVLTPGKLCCVTGRRLKLGGDKYCLSLIPCSADGTVDETADAIEIEKSQIRMNTNTQIAFFIPHELPADTGFVVRVETMYQTGRLSRRTSVVGESLVLHRNK